jgi:hypothetical protein
VNGSLVVEVAMKSEYSDTPILPFIPENPSKCESVGTLYLDEMSADVIFMLGGIFYQMMHQERRNQGLIQLASTRILSF